jgi:hypothetical protein
MYKRPDFLDCPNKGEERRRIEMRRMSRCFTLVYYWWFRKTQVIPELGVFYKKWGRLWRVV